MILSVMGWNKFSDSLGYITIAGSDMEKGINFNRREYQF